MQNNGYFMRKQEQHLPHHPNYVLWAERASHLMRPADDSSICWVFKVPWVISAYNGKFKNYPASWDLFCWKKTKQNPSQTREKNVLLFRWLFRDRSLTHRMLIKVSSIHTKQQNSLEIYCTYLATLESSYL